MNVSSISFIFARRRNSAAVWLTAQVTWQWRRTECFGLCEHSCYSGGRLLQGAGETQWPRAASQNVLSAVALHANLKQRVIQNI
jgi:hypothetical protein